MKLAKALLFCFERSSKLDEMAHMHASIDISSRPDSSDEAERHHYHGPSSQPALGTPNAEVEQDTLVAEIMNIQSAGFSTSSLATVSSLPSYPVSSMSATLSPAPIVRISAAEPVKPLGPTPNVLIVEDNPINVCINNLIVCIASRLLTVAHHTAYASGNIHSEEKVSIHKSREWISRCGSREGKG
jgi:hypothetical protein